MHCVIIFMNCTLSCYTRLSDEKKNKLVMIQDLINVQNNFQHFDQYFDISAIVFEELAMDFNNCHQESVIIS